MPQYPAALVTTTQLPITRADATATPTNHKDDHNRVNDEVIAIEAELGINPRGAYSTVVARLDDLSVNLPPLTVRNVTGGTLTKGTVCSINGSSSQTPTIVASIAAQATQNLPAVGILVADINNNTTAAVLRTLGDITNFNTSAWSEGDRLFVSTTAGLLVSTEPSHPNLRQRVAIVTNSHATLGKLLVVIGAVRGDHEGTNRNTWVVGDGVNTVKSITFREAHDNLLRADTTAARTWDLPNTSGVVIVNQGVVSDYVDLAAVSAEPAAPAAGFGRLYGKAIVSNEYLRPKWKAPAGIDFYMQPSLAQQRVALIGPGAAAVVSTVGTEVTSVGTVTHVAPTTTLPYASNFVTTAAANATAGTGHNVTQLLIGQTGITGMIYYYSRFYGPDGTYADSRWFAGVTSTTMALCASETPGAWTGHRAGFYSASDGTIANRWYFRTRNNVTTTETAIATRNFEPQKVYDAYVWIPKNSATIYWRLDNATDGWSEVGSTSATIPANATALRGGTQMATVTAVARNMRIGAIYTESDY